MKKIKHILLRQASTLAALALALGFSTGFGQHCRTWFYQPEVPHRD